MVELVSGRSVINWAYPSSYLMTSSVSAVHYLCSLNGWVISQAPDEVVLMYQQQFLLTQPGMSLGQIILVSP